MSTVKQQSKVVNGVDVERLMGTIKAVKAEPALAKFTFRADNQWIQGGHNRSQVQNFYGAGQEDTSRTKPFVLDNDEPDVLLGGDAGANPVEQVLHGLAGCLTTSLVYHAAAKGIVIEEVESKFEGDIDLRGFLGLSKDVRNGYENIRVTMRIKADVSDEQIAELGRMAQGLSPVFDTISNPVAVQVKAERK